MKVLNIKVAQSTALEPTARAYVAEVLLESLDHKDDFAVSTEWRAEIQQRCAAVDAGTVELLDGEQILQELRETTALPPRRTRRNHPPTRVLPRAAAGLRVTS